MRSKLPEILLAKEKQLSRKIQIKEIADETGLSRNTISAWLSYEIFGRVDSDSATKLMRWAECTLDDLLEPVEINQS